MNSQDGLVQVSSPQELSEVHGEVDVLTIYGKGWKGSDFKAIANQLPKALEEVKTIYVEGLDSDPEAFFKSLTNCLLLFTLGIKDVTLDSRSAEAIGLIPGLEKLSVEASSIDLNEFLVHFSKNKSPVNVFRLNVGKVAGELKQSGVDSIKNLMYLTSIDFTFHKGTISAKDFHVFGVLPRLKTIGLIGAPFDLSQVSALCPSSLRELSLEVSELDSESYRHLSQLSMLESLEILARKIKFEDFNLLGNLKGLHRFSLSVPRATDIPHASEALADLGWIKVGRRQGLIGEWYETGKEKPCREFSFGASDFNGPDGGEFTLRGGEDLTIFEPKDKKVLFHGILQPETADWESEWFQKGIAHDLWAHWFREKFPALLVTYHSVPGYSISIKILEEKG